MAFWHAGWFKYLKNFLIGIGAAFIIIGALLKIIHHPLANEVLVYAMVGEAAIFAIQAIIPPEKEYYWDKLYPGLSKYNAQLEPMAYSAGGAAIAGGGSGTTQRLDEALDQAGISTNLIDRLGSHLNNLGDNLGRLTEVTSAAGVTSEYTTQATEAAAALSRVKTAYNDAATVASDLATAAEDTKQYHEQVQLVSKNLAQLNAVYELELQDTNNHLKALNKFYSNLTSAINNLDESVADTERYKQQMHHLATNLSHLNNVYGNMLTAMAMGSKAAK